MGRNPPTAREATGMAGEEDGLFFADLGALRASALKTLLCWPRRSRKH